MPARIIDISDPNIKFPDFVILDASIVLELTPNPSFTHKHHILAKNLFERLYPLAQQGQIMLLFPLLAFEECLFKLIQRDIMAQIPKPAEWHYFYKANPEVILHAQSTIHNFCTILKGFPIVILTPEDIHIPVRTAPRLEDRLVEMLFKFCVLPKDATILSEAERLGIYTVITLDSDWRRADGFTVITAP